MTQSANSNKPGEPESHSPSLKVDQEPEPEAAPALPTARPVNVFARDDQCSDAKIDRITEDELLEGLARSIPPDAAHRSAPTESEGLAFCDRGRAYRRARR